MYIDLIFHDCQSLTSIDVSHFKTDKINSMVGLFQGCRNLESIDLSNFNTEEVTNMKEMFHGCRSLTSIDLSKFQTKKVTRMDYMMYKCNNLNYIDISTFSDENNKYISLFNHLPDKGTIKIKRSLYNQIKDQIPEDWNLKIID